MYEIEQIASSNQALAYFVKYTRIYLLRIKDTVWEQPSSSSSSEEGSSQREGSFSAALLPNNNSFSSGG